MSPEAVDRPDLARPAARTNADEELRLIIRILMRRWLVILCALLFSILVSVVIAYQLPARYTAEAVVMLDMRRTQVVDVEAVVSGLRPEAAVVRSEMDVISSRVMAAKVTDRLDLLNAPDFNGTAPLPHSLFSYVDPVGWFRSLVRLVGAGAQGPAEPQTEEERRAELRERIITEVRAGLRTSNDGRSFSIRISYTSRDPLRAAQLANAYADTYLVDQLEAKYEATRRANEWLSSRLGELRDQVRIAEEAVTRYREEQNLVEARGGTVTAQQLAEINSQLVIARTERTQAEARLRGAQTLLQADARGAATSEALTSALIQRLREEESQLRRREAELATRYGPRHPTMINLQAEIRNIQEKLRDEARRIVQSLANDLQVARAKEASLQQSLNQLQSQSGVSLQAEVKLRELEREAQANRLLYENFLGRFKETTEQKDLQTSDARLISNAVVPAAPSYPNKSLIAMFGLGFGLLLGMGLAFAIERLDRGFRLAEDVEAQTDTSVLAVVPALKRGSPPPEEFLLTKPLSSFSEAMRTVRTAIHFSNVDSPPKVIMVTSAVPGEGKSTLCLSLARSLASSGNKVLLIDADLRRPRIGSALAGNGHSGDLSELLIGDRSPEEVIRVDTRTDLHYVVAQSKAPNPQDLLASRQMERFVRGCADVYDYVIIDTPPVMAVADAISVSRYVDACLFVLRWAETPRDFAITAIRTLRKYNVPVIGTVLSMVNVRQQAKYGYGDHGYYYSRYSQYYKD
ncbi:polysaccharide biosynthesis tyrosine autokinase [Rhodocista pekingensis]|uniref:non-specific protein-tyrosine kinase n=1 Tax=Rhodocista pekingensis TaxID=201185 RepID=A0ABW2L105_9PROT